MGYTSRHIFLNEGVQYFISLYLKESYDEFQFKNSHISYLELPITTYCMISIYLIIGNKIPYHLNGRYL